MMGRQEVALGGRIKGRSMRRTALLVVVFVLATMSPAGAATKTIQADSEAFQWKPSSVAGLAGDTVQWVNDGGFHNVSSTTGMFRSGAPGSLTTYTRTLSAGTFPFM